MADARHGTAMLSVRDVGHSFGGVRALQGCSLDVFEGEICGLIGPNGAGKSTLISCVGGALVPDEGDITFQGQAITGLAPSQRFKLGVARSFQLSQEWPKMTVLENVLVAQPEDQLTGLFGALFLRRRIAEAERALVHRAMEILELFDLYRLRNAYASELSGGQKRLLELARIWMADPKIALLDEPMAGVNPALKSRIATHLKEMREHGITFVLVEHDLRTVAQLCDRVIVMAEGTVLASGTFQQIQQNESVVNAYLGVAR
jgi:ABC-type branched-subunit amino acid transport system ATPase component